MKKNKITIIEILLIFILGIFIGLNVFDKRDVNRDGKISAQDYVIIKKYIMDKGSDK